jgi:hypothetical protein
MRLSQVYLQNSYSLRLVDVQEQSYSKMQISFVATVKVVRVQES